MSGFGLLPRKPSTNTLNGWRLLPAAAASFPADLGGDWDVGRGKNWRFWSINFLPIRQWIPQSWDGGIVTLDSSSFLTAFKFSTFLKFSANSPSLAIMGRGGVSHERHGLGPFPRAKHTDLILESLSSSMSLNRASTSSSDFTGIPRSW